VPEKLKKHNLSTKKKLSRPVVAKKNKAWPMKKLPF